MSRLLAATTLSICLGVAAGCASSRVPFTHELRVRHGLSADELKNLQYYASNTITLRRVIRTSGKQITDGHRLVLTSGQRVEEVVVAEGTPGAAVDVGPDYITVSFEANTFLTFALRGANVPSWLWERGALHNLSANPFPGNPDAGEMDRHPDEPAYGGGNFWLYVPGSDNRVPFAGTWFEAAEDTLRSHLLIDSEALEEEEEAERVLGGVRL